jgi:hypothetical protein
MAKARPIQGLDVQAPTGNNARIIAKVRLEEMYQWERYVDSPSHERELHNLRIGAKRLRYTLEIFEDVLPEACKPFVQELERIQEELGALHDSDVMIALLQYRLSSSEGGAIYKEALAEAKQQHEQFELPPELLTNLLDPASAPTAEQRRGLEQLLLEQQQIREERITTFRQHWHQLQACNFRSQLLSILDT